MFDLFTLSGQDILEVCVTMIDQKKLLIFVFLLTFTVLSALIAQDYYGDYEYNAVQDGSYGSSVNYVPGEYDRNGDGLIDLIIVDRNGDGMGDYWATDRNFDGIIDDYQYDRNFDGIIDQWEYDMTGNGVPDRIYVDSNFDGEANMYAVINPVTQTYTWYGDMNTINASNSAPPEPPQPQKTIEKRVNFPSLQRQVSYVGGKAAFSE